MQYLEKYLSLFVRNYNITLSDVITKCCLLSFICYFYVHILDSFPCNRISLNWFDLSKVIFDINYRQIYS